MANIICRICTLTETALGNPRMNQFTLGDIDKGTIEDGGFYIGYGGVNLYWKGGGLRPIYILWRHSANLYAVFCTKGPGDIRKNFVEASPRNGMRGYPYVEQATHGWRVFRCSGTDLTDPVNPVPIYGRLYRFSQQPPAPSAVSVSTPWTIGKYSITELVPSLEYTLAGYDLPSYAYSTDPESDNGELD